MSDEHSADCGCEEYSELSRRNFLLPAAGVATAAAARARSVPRLASKDRARGAIRSARAM